MKSQPTQDAFQLLGSGTAYRDELCTLISGTQLFRDFDWTDIETLANYMQAYSIPKDTTLFNEGDNGTYMCLIIEGMITIYKQDQNNQEKLVANISNGKTLGEMAIIDGEPRSATAIAAEHTTIAMLTKNNFQLIMSEKPGLSTKILLKISRLLSQRLRQTSGQLVDYLAQ